MSRLGKLPIEIKPGTQVKIENGFIVVKGAKGELRQATHPKVNIEITDKEVVVSVKNSDSRDERSLWGLYRSLINNMMIGVTDGFEKKLEINGVGYKAQASGQKITLNLGLSHPVIFELPKGIAGKVEQNVITISGIDKQLVGEISAQIRQLRKPEPYKGKGIKYSTETILRKAGKTASK